MVTRGYRKYEEKGGRRAGEKCSIIFVNLIVREWVKLGRAGREEWRLKCLKARQRWKGTSHCRQGLGRMWWCRNVTSDTTLSSQETCLLSLWPRSALVWPRALQHATFPQYWIGRAFPFLMWSVKAEALTDPGSVLSDSWLEHDPALAVNAEGARPQGIWDDRPDHVGKGSSPAKQGMLLSVWHEIWAIDMGSQSHRQSILPIALPQPSWTTTTSWGGRWAEKQDQSLLGHCVHAVRQGQSNSGCVWVSLGQQAVHLPGKFTARGHPAWGGPWKGGVNVSLTVSPSWGYLNSQM